MPWIAWRLDWKALFPEVFKDGGFDIVIGNPPYVKLQASPKDSENLSLTIGKLTEEGHL